MGNTLDMTAMHAMHDTLRREAQRLARVTARVDADPRIILRTTAHWELFKTSLNVHHSAEDDALWPVLRQNLAGRPSRLALLEAMEAEHSAIDQVIEAVDAALAGPETGLDRLGDLTDSLVTGLIGHLRHEEDQALPLIQAFITQEQWAHFGQIQASGSALTPPASFPGRQWRRAYMAGEIWSAPTTRGP